MFLRFSTRLVFAMAASLFLPVIGASPGFRAEAGMVKQAGKKHDLKRQVQALEVQWRDAQLAGDIPTMDKMLSDDYVGISMTGQVNTKAQQLDRLRSRKISLTKMDLEDVSVKLIGSGVAVVTSRVSVEGINEGTPIKGIYRYTRVYQRLPSGMWKITNFEATRMSPNASGVDKADRERPSN